MEKELEIQAVIGFRGSFFLLVKNILIDFRNGIPRPSSPSR